MDKIDDFFHSLYGLPGYGLVFLFCIVFGYGLRMMRSFPNDGIPLVIILLGGILNLVMAAKNIDGTPLRIWIGTNVIIGSIIGFLAWIVHKKAIKYLERWIIAKFPAARGLVEDTAFLDKESAGLNPSDPQPQNETKP